MNTPQQRTMAPSRRGAAGRNRRAAAALEFALVAPILTVLLLGAIDVGQFANVGQAVSNASREGARVAAREDTLNVSEVESAVSGYLANSFPNVPTATLDAAVEVNVTDGGGGAVWGGDLTTISTGSPLSVEVVVQFDCLRWLDVTGLMDGRTLRTTTVMRRE